MTEKTQRKFTRLFMAAVMALLTVLMAVLAGHTVSSVNQGDIQFLENTVSVLLEGSLTQEVGERYAKKYGICILSEEIPEPLPEGMPVGLLLEELKKSRESFSVEESTLGDGSLILWSLHRLTAEGKPYYGLRMSVSVQGRLDRAYTVFAPRKGVWEILGEDCWLYLAGWLAMGGSLYWICRPLVQGILEPVEEAWKMQRDFTAAAAHELKAPLAVIQASAEAAEEDPEKLGEHLERIGAECRRLSRLTEGLLELASSDAGGRPFRLEEVDVDSLLIETWESVRPLAAKAGLELKLSLSEDAYPSVTADRERLGQVLRILLDNAISYSPVGTEIEFSAIKVPRGLAITVADHGPGIPEKERSRVTERFYRCDPSRTAKNHFGLGLSIAGEIVKQHGFTLTFAETPGGGCTVQVKIPYDNFPLAGRTFSAIMREIGKR